MIFDHLLFLNQKPNYYPDSNYFQIEEVKKRNENNIVRRIAKLIYAYEQGIFPTSYYVNKYAKIIRSHWAVENSCY